MLKVLFFIESLGGGGAEKVLIDLVNHMDQAKFDITVQTLWPSENQKKLAAGIRYRSAFKIENRMNIFRMRLESALGLTYLLHLKDNYDIEVAYLECGSTKILSSSTNRKAAKIAWVHSDLSVKMADVLETFVKKASLQYAKYDRVVCVSEDSLSSFRRLFGRKIQTDVIYNTIDDEKIREQSAAPLPAGISKRRRTLLSLGRLSREKAYDRLLRVHKRLLEEGYEHDLWILGEGDLRPELERFIKDNQLEESGRLMGFQENPYPFMQAADLLVCSSQYEGFSTFITEGLILGKPIVTTNCAGMRELLGASEFGLITENSEKGLYEGLKQLLEDQERLKSFELAASKRGTVFSASSLATQTERFLEQAFSSKQNQ